MVVDGWVNLFPEAFAAKWVAQEEDTGVVELFGEDLAKGPSVDGLLAAMDDAARALPLSEAGMAEYLGGAATRLLAR